MRLTISAPTENERTVTGMAEYIEREAAIEAMWCDRHCKMNGDDDCNRCLRSWLQQPAEMSIKDDCLGGANDTTDI